MGLTSRKHRDKVRFMQRVMVIVNLLYEVEQTPGWTSAKLTWTNIISVFYYTYGMG
jgi:hypothetical protein